MAIKIPSIIFEYYLLENVKLIFIEIILARYERLPYHHNYFKFFSTFTFQDEKILKNEMFVTLSLRKLCFNFELDVLIKLGLSLKFYLDKA